VATALAAAVRMAVIERASATQASSPVTGSKVSTTPWCEGRPTSMLRGKTLRTLAPNIAVSPMAPGITPNMRPSSKCMIERSSWRVCPAESAIIAARTAGMQTS
jgi:hypothetical protein